MIRLSTRLTGRQTSGAGRGRRVAAAIVVTAAMLGACSAHPGAAVIVDNHRYTQHEVNESAKAMTLITNQQIDAATIATVLSQSHAVDAIAADHGVSVSDDDVKNLVARVSAEQNIEVNDVTVSVLRYMQNIQMLGQSGMSKDEFQVEMAQKLAGVSVEINPRYFVGTAPGKQPLPGVTFADTDNAVTPAQPGQ